MQSFKTNPCKNCAVQKLSLQFEKWREWRECEVVTSTRSVYIPHMSHIVTLSGYHSGWSGAVNVLTCFSSLHPSGQTRLTPLFYGDQGKFIEMRLLIERRGGEQFVRQISSHLTGQSLLLALYVPYTWHLTEVTACSVRTLQDTAWSVVSL